MHLDRRQTPQPQMKNVPYPIPQHPQTHSTLAPNPPQSTANVSRHAAVPDQRLPPPTPTFPQPGEDVIAELPPPPSAQPTASSFSQQIANYFLRIRRRTAQVVLHHHHHHNHNHQIDPDPQLSPEEVPSATSTMAATDGQIILAASRFGDAQPVYLKDFARSDLPAVGKIVKGQYYNLGVPTLSNPSLQSTALYLNAGKMYQILAQPIKLKEGRKATNVGPKVLIPETYPGVLKVFRCRSNCGIPVDPPCEVTNFPNHIRWTDLLNPTRVGSRWKSDNLPAKQSE
ncbi:uncharacterized protein LOC129758684 [Uranotaenia lowii]|uniref:uncharacterized protein LOC129758684 n=1 Tax=Uranotaenia lowii TaxID=190385 RepID=UPI00247B093F|nr:uncharacterized protein LOC129758684 [Uranotaenia lowii]